MHRMEVKKIEKATLKNKSLRASLLAVSFILDDFEDF